MIRWHWTRFDELRLGDLYDALALRCRVFAVEQQCAYLDPDGADRHAWHLLGRDEAGALQAYLRAIDPGVKYTEPSIGRVITAPEVRGSGQGRALMIEGLQRCRSAWPGLGVRISAQARLQAFYGSLGFQGVGEPYPEDGIAHLEMVWSPR